MPTETGAIKPGDDLFQGRAKDAGGRQHIAHIQRFLAMRTHIGLAQNTPENLLHIYRRGTVSVRIPRHLDTQPTIIWTLVPCSLGHLIHVHLDRQSERSDAGLHC